MRDFPRKAFKEKRKGPPQAPSRPFAPRCDQDRDRRRRCGGRRPVFSPQSRPCGPGAEKTAKEALRPRRRQEGQQRINERKGGKKTNTGERRQQQYRRPY